MGKKEKDNNGNSNNNQPKEITKDCNICGMGITARPEDIFTAMAVHKAVAHGG